MKTALGVIGILLIVGTVAGGNLSHIGDWSTGELVGYNTWSIIAVLGGAAMAYFGFKKSKKV